MSSKNQDVPLCLVDNTALLRLVFCTPSQSSTIPLLLAAEECGLVSFDLGWLWNGFLHISVALSLVFFYWKDVLSYVFNQRVTHYWCLLCPFCPTLDPLPFSQLYPFFSTVLEESLFSDRYEIKGMDKVYFLFLQPLAWECIKKQAWKTQYHCGDWLIFWLSSTTFMYYYYYFIVLFLTYIHCAFINVFLFLFSFFLCTGTASLLRLAISYCVRSHESTCLTMACTLQILQGKLRWERIALCWEPSLVLALNAKQNTNYAQKRSCQWEVPVKGNTGYDLTCLS